MSNATQTFREVKRKANAGERIKIVNAILPGGRYNAGDEFVVDRSAKYGVYVNYTKGNVNGTAGIHDNEYVVLEPIATPAPLAETAALSLPDLFAQFIRDNAPAVRSYLAELSAEPLADVFEIATPLTRGKVIEMARERVAELKRFGSSLHLDLPKGTPFHYRYYNVEFHVNRDKRTVTALVHVSGNQRKPSAVGIAKAAPDDVFNADIGKAVAAERALGLAVTEAFVNAPKPADDKLAPGTIVYLNEGRYEYKLGERRPEKDGACDVGFAYWLNAGWDGAANFTKLDDTDADYTELDAKDGDAA